MSKLGNIFQDVNSWIASNVGSVGTTILIVLLSVLALILFSKIVVSLTPKKESKDAKIKRWSLILLIILILIIVWLCFSYSAPKTYY